MNPSRPAPGISVYVTEPIHPQAQALLAGSVRLGVGDEDVTPEELRRRVADVDVILSKTDPVPIDSEVIDAAPRLRLIARHGSGYSNVDVDHATRRGIVVTSTPGVNAVTIAGASGAIGGAISRGFARAGANLALLYHRNADAAERIEAEASGLGVTARTYRVDVADAESMRANADRIVADFGGIHILLNSAGGNLKSAITDAGTGFFDLAPRAIQDTMTLNFMGGAVLPCLFHGARMVANETGGAIINISSMNAVRPLEGRPAYAASKAAVSNFTQWLACHVARHYTPLIRVNAIAPGFFPNERMRASLFNDDGSYTERARRIIDHTPMGRLGSVDDLVGTTLWYASDASRFVTGTVTPVDGGFSAYGGV